MRSAEEGQTIAQPQQPSTQSPHPCPSRPANGGTENRRKGSGRRRHPLPETRRPGRRSPPPAPLWSAYNHEDIGGRGALPGRSAIRKRGASRGTPEGQPAARHRVETAGVPRLAEETHQGGTARADNTRSSRRKRRYSTSATEVMHNKAKRTETTREGGLQLWPPRLDHELRRSSQNRLTDTA